MEYRRLGRTGLQVSALGFGAWEIGWTRPEEGEEVGRLRWEAIDWENQIISVREAKC